MLNAQDTQTMLDAGYSVADLATLDYCACGSGAIATYLGGVCLDCSEDDYQE